MEPVQTPQHLLTDIFQSNKNSGIYKIIYLLNKKFYIGRACNLFEWKTKFCF